MRWYKKIDAVPDKLILEKLESWFAEDMPKGDVTTDSLELASRRDIRTIFRTRERLVVCGVDIIRLAFREQGCRIFTRDGEGLLAGAAIAEVTGNAADILRKERVVLNLLQHLSGIATLTREYCTAGKGKIEILDTRKTTPGLRLFEKYAVHCGGGRSHRLDLSSGIMIKDNHIAAAGSVKKAVKACRKTYPDMILELEVDNLKQLQEGLEAGIDAILLDNMNGETVKEAVELIRNHSNGKKIYIEASGGITLKTIENYIDTGINGVSIGALTHSAVAADIGLDIL